ncbi:hypothetical protein DSECCO2_483250 [anaerobic digester metagenome]|jgi:hypothetical protein
MQCEGKSNGRSQSEATEPQVQIETEVSEEMSDIDFFEKLKLQITVLKKLLKKELNINTEAEASEDQ